MTPPIVKRYLIALDKYKWIGLTSFGLVVAGSTVVAMQPEPPTTYVATGALSYNSPPVSFSTTGTEIQRQGQDLSEAMLLSDPIINSVAAKVNTKPKTIAQNVGVKLPKKSKDGDLQSSIIEVRYQGSDPKQASEMVVLLMQAMVEQSNNINTGRLKEIVKKIDQRLPEAKQALQASERKLEQYDRTQGPAILASETESLLTAITSSQGQQQQIKLALSGIDAQIRSLQQKLGLSASQAYVSSALSADPIIADLRRRIYETESQMELLKKDLRPQHPTMIQLQHTLETSEKLLQERAAEVVGGGGAAAPLTSSSTAIRTQSNLDPARQQLANNLVGLQTQRDTLQQQVLELIKAEQRYRQEYARIPNKQLERARLEQQVLLTKALYDQMEAKRVDAQAAEAETVSSLSIARPPAIAEQAAPAKSVPITLAIGSLMGLLVGGGVVFLLGSLEGTFKTMEDIRESLRQREVALLGVLPLMPTFDFELDEVPVVISPDSPYLEFYERFRSNLRRIADKNLKVVLISSTSTQEGKTVSAYNLGVASARAGKRTLIVETDLRSPSKSKTFKVAADPQATIEPLRYYGSLSECIHLVPDVENLYIIPSPGPLRQAAAILESSEIRRLMEDVRGRFDLVILDTPSLSLSNDALLIEPYCDGIVLVTRPNFTQENLLAEAVDQLTESDLPLLGAIINGADIAVALPVPVAQSPAQSFGEESEILEQPASRGRNN